jgi:hypothetical protein
MTALAWVRREARVACVEGQLPVGPLSSAELLPVSRNHE